MTTFVPGIPRPAGSKTPFPIYRGPRGGDRTFTGRVAMVDSSGDAGKAWRATVQLAVRQAHRGAPLEGPVAVTIAFSLPRPKAHFTARGTLRPSAPPYPIGRPDVDKLSRGCLDAMKAIVYGDDSQVVKKCVTKLYASAEGVGALIEVAPLAGAALTQREHAREARAEGAA